MLSGFDQPPAYALAAQALLDHDRVNLATKTRAGDTGAITVQVVKD